MTIDFTQVINDQDNLPLQDFIAMQADTTKSVVLTLGRASSHALMTQDQTEQLSGEDKFYRGMLAFKVRDDDKAELKVEDIVLLKKLIAKLYSPIVVYRAFKMLDKNG